MDQQEYPFRPRGKRGFDREDVINYISQAQQRCNEHLARMEELEAAKNAWYTQAKGLEKEKAALAARNRELEERLERDGSPAEGELSDLKARCQELEAALEEKNAARQEEAGSQKAQPEAPRFILHQQEAASLRSQLDKQVASVQAYASRVAALEQENGALQQQLRAAGEAQQTENDGLLSAVEQEKDSLSQELSELTASLQAREAEKAVLAEKLALLEQEKAAQAAKIFTLEREKASLAAQLASLEGARIACEERTALQAQLTQLGEVTRKLKETELAKAFMAKELEEAREELETSARDAAAQAGVAAALQEERDGLQLRAAELAQAEALARQQYAALAEEDARLRTRLAELEAASAQHSEETVRSMVLSSFNYADLYVDNNLKTAQIVAETTSRNIGRVSDSATSLMEQVEDISRAFADTTDTVRRDLAAFQRELAAIQSGMARRLSKDRFNALLEENERLRARLESELVAELSSEEEEEILPPMQEPADQRPLPFAEELPPSYHAYLDE